MKSLRKPKESSAKVARDRLHKIIHMDRLLHRSHINVFPGATMVIGKPYKYYRKGE